MGDEKHLNKEYSNESLESKEWRTKEANFDYFEAKST